MATKVRISGDRPFPFIFCSKNYALAQYGAFIKSALSDGVSLVNSSYPIENIIDGNRATYAQLEKIGRMYSSNPNHINIKLDVSATGFTSNVENEINMIAIECDPMYPARQIKITTYTDSNFTSNSLVHNVSRWNYVSVGGLNFYDYGIRPRIDTDYLTPRVDSLRPDGFDGRYIFIFLDDAITYTRPYILINIRSVGRNIVGWDGTFDNGLWDASNNEVLTTSDPALTGNGTNNNHIRLFTDVGTGGHQVTQYSRWVSWVSRPKSTYVFRWWGKEIGYYISGNNDGYRIEILYYDKYNTLISSGTLYQSYGDLTSWTNCKAIINYFDPVDAKYKSGTGLWKHEVPAGTEVFQIRFMIRYSSSWYLTWKIDDICIYNASHIMAKLKTYDTFTQGDVLLNIPLYNDLTGICKIKRIGAYGFNFASSQSTRKRANNQDLSGYAGPNPTELSDTEEGKIFTVNAHGRVLSQFIPRGGTKRNRTISMIGSAQFRNAILDIDKSAFPFGLIDPHGDFGDYVITPGAMNWSAIDAQRLKSPSISSSIKWTEASDFLWSGVITLKEA